jgi:hypothetical protein
MEVGCHRGMIANEHIMIGSNSDEKVKNPSNTQAL